jgi:hypothetical protein
MERRKGNAAKWSLKTELLQYRGRQGSQEAIAYEWKSFLWEQIGLKKSSLFSGVQIYNEFGHLLLVPVDGASGDDAWDVPCEYASIPSSSLKLLLKVAKGVNDDAKEEWLREAATLSYSDFKRLVDEATGKELHECGPWEKRKPGSASRAGKSERKRLTVRLDNEARRLCKLRDHGLCRRCGKRGDQVHHIFSRRHGSIRFVLSNLLLLCDADHRYAIATLMISVRGLFRR